MKIKRILLAVILIAPQTILAGDRESCITARHAYNNDLNSVFDLELECSRASQLALLLANVYGQSHPDTQQAITQANECYQNLNDLKLEMAAREESVNDACDDYASVLDIDKAFYHHGKFEVVSPSAGTWREVGNDGATFDFIKTHHDDWSIYLESTDRPGVYIQIDLWRQMIRYRGPGYSGYVDLYSITKVSSFYDFL